MNKSKSLLEDFLRHEYELMEEEGYLCLMMCEEENDFHMTTYWISGTYDECKSWLIKNNNFELLLTIKQMYSDFCGDIITLEDKVKNKFENGNYELFLSVEALCSLILKIYQGDKKLKRYLYGQDIEITPTVWNSVYGAEENDFCDLYNKYNLLTALNNPEDFPVIRTSDIVSAMYGMGNLVHPSDMYDVFAYNGEKYINELQKKTVLFTPDLFMFEAVQGRYKAYSDMKKDIIGSKGRKNKNKYFIDYVELFNEGERAAALVEELTGTSKNYVMAAYIAMKSKEDYLNRYSLPPYSFPLQEKNINVDVITTGDRILLQVTFKIRGIENKRNVWKDICATVYEVPQMPLELQEFIINMATDIKIALAGFEAQKETKSSSAVAAIEGKYPRKVSLSHGLTLIDDLNVEYKDKRGIRRRKDEKPRYTLNLAEVQSMYVLKKTLRYSKRPVVSCSFGNDSLVALHQTRRVTKHGFKVAFNDSRIEYTETRTFKKQLLDLWDLHDEFIQLFSDTTLWDIVDEYGFNLDRKGSRTVKSNGSKVSVSEICCKKIKHEPILELFNKGLFDCDISGLRGAESLARELASKRDGMVYYAKSWNLIRLNPIVHFSLNYVKSYIEKYNLIYNSIYDKVLYYEDVFDNCSQEEYGQIYYQPRVGCQYCVLTVKYGYLAWMKRFKNKEYNFLMRERGLARELYSLGTGIKLPPKKTKVKKMEQVSLFTENKTTASESNNLFEFSEDFLMDNIDFESMEYLIQKRPCIFQYSV